MITLLTRWRLQASLVLVNPLPQLALNILVKTLPNRLLQVPKTAPPADRHIGQRCTRLQPK